MLLPFGHGALVNHISPVHHIRKKVDQWDLLPQSAAAGKATP